MERRSRLWQAWILICCLLVGTTSSRAQTPVQQNGQLQVIGLKLCNQYGHPIQLRGMSTHGLQWYGLGDCITDASLDALANDWKADHLRISLYVQEGGYDTDPAGFTAQVSTIIDKVTARGMYAVVDWHQLTPGDPNANLAKAKTFFTNIANAHKNKNNIIYDICNEPNGVTWARIKTYADQLIPVIRAIDADAPILVGTHAWASLGISDGRSAQDIVSNPLSFSNIMYTFHFYAASHGQEYLDELDWASDRLPIFVTEFGTQTASGDGSNNFTMSQRYIDLMRQKKISWTNWNYSDDSRSGAVWLSGTCSGGPWTVARLKPAGVWVRERILSPADDFPGGGGNVPPTVSITSPANNASFTASASVTINATAADSDGSITKVEFFQGASLIGTDSTSPYSVTWPNVGAGSYALTAKATDNGNASTTSSPVNITVTGAPGCPAVIASGDDGNVPANVLDNNLATRWSASGDGQWIQFCLSDTLSVTGVQIAFYNGTSRTSTFDVLVGNDGSNWTTASAGRVSSGTSNNLETFNFSPVSGKYVRIVGHGNSVNAWNSYTEVKINTSTGGGGTVTLSPVQDAYVRDGTNAGTTFGTTDPTLLITKVSPTGQLNNAREAYLQFELASVTGTISSVTLKVYGKVDGTSVPSVPVGLYPVANTTWTESTLTWNNKPASGTTSFGTNTVVNTAYAYYNWDVTSYVQSELTAGRTKVSFAMKSLAQHDPRIFWNSDEAAGNRPQLVVETSGSGSRMSTPVSLVTEPEQPGKVTFNSYPNPFKVSNTITFSLEKGGETSLIAYDMQGRQVSVLVKGFLSAGTHRTTFTPPAAATGIYLLKLVYNGKTEVRRVVKE